MRVLLATGFNICGAETTRSLARSGHEVDLALTLAQGRSRFQPLFASRYARKRIPVPHPRENPAGFQYRILEICKAERYDVILPIGEEALISLASIEDELLPHVRLAFDRLERLQAIHDKYRLMKRLSAAGFDIPRIYPYSSADDLHTLDITFPVVVKARKHSGAATGTRYAHNLTELISIVQDFNSRPSTNPTVSDFTQPLIQEYIPGSIHDAYCVSNHGDGRCIVTTTRKVTYPTTGGISVTAATTNEPLLARYAREILDFLQIHGITDIEVKKDDRDGRFKLLEINPRLGGLVGVVIRAGIPLPTLGCELAVHGDTSPRFDYRHDLHYTVLFPRTFLALKERTGQRWTYLRDTFQHLRKGRSEVDLLDPMPHVFDVLNTCRMLLTQTQGKDF